MTTKRKFIATDLEQTAIYGVGDTPERAEHDAMSWAAGSVETYRFYQKTELGQYPGFYVYPATEALVKVVMEDSGELAWGTLPDGTHCTFQEWEISEQQTASALEGAK